MSALANSLSPAPGDLNSPKRLEHFVRCFTALLNQEQEEQAILKAGKRLLRSLIAVDDWLPETHARPSMDQYKQYLLYLDPTHRFCVVSFVWGPGQSTPIHDHRIWGIVGVLRGAELAESFDLKSNGLYWIRSERLEAGMVDTVSPGTQDIHRVSNAVADGVTISIHVYGADIGAHPRATYDGAGNPTRFISAYADAPPIDFGEQS